MKAKRVLIIDDEETIQAVVQTGLQIMTDWQVFTASSGPQGIQIAQTEQPDVILLDLIMPMMDGLTTFKALQAHPETQFIPVIFLTASLQTTEQQQFHDLGVSGVITKPFDALTLPNHITCLLHWS
jgi:two-component system, OmpR family, alkaline phosphatase synthesis response regulator PhoP